MESCDRTELVKEKTVKSPVFANDVFVLSVKIFHFSLNKAVPPFSVLQYGILRCAVLFLILFDNEINMFFDKLSVVLVSEDFDNFCCCSHV